MRTDRSRYNALIVSRTEKTAASLSSILASNQFSSVCTADTAGKGRKIALEKKIDLVVINAPLADDFGTRLAVDLAERNIGVLLLVKSDVYDQTAYKVEDLGIITLSKPVTKPILVQSIKMLRAMQAKIAKLEAQKSTLETKMKEIRLVNRAKWILIKQLKMSEGEAHKYIEKAAMDGCVKKSEVAENIIRTYEV